MKDIFIEPNTSILDAMHLLEKTSEKCLLVINHNRKLLGTLTDGDLRRAILKGTKFSENIEKCFNSNPRVMNQNIFSDKDAIKIMKENKIELLPIVNDKMIVIDYAHWTNLGDSKESKTLSDVKTVIMAGGKGTRMKPFTDVLPKPLIPIKGEPIIEHIIQRFQEYGCNDFFLTINYKGSLLKAYFEELNPDYNFDFIEEEKFLGTAGSLRILKDEFDLDDPFFVTNCDIIIKKDYNKIYNFHLEQNHDLTLIASAKQYLIPYGTCELNSDGHLQKINEKPSYDFLVNTGLYVINPDLLKFIPKSTFFHITDLIEIAIEKEKKIGVFPVEDDSWIDIGQWKEYRNALERL